MRSIGFLVLLSITTAEAQQFVPDPEFGEQGVSFHPKPAGINIATAISLHSLVGGKFLMGFLVGNDGGFISGHLANGDRDSSFAVDGIHTISAPAGWYLNLRSVDTTTDGRIIALSNLQGMDVGTRAFQFNCLLADGTPDTSFGEDGSVVIPGPDNMYVRSVAVQSDGKILFGGAVYGDLLLGRLEPSGELDTSFGTGGMARYSSPGVGMHLFRIRTAPNGDIFMAGSMANSFDATGLMVCKVLPDGTRDSSFGNNGFFFHDHSENVYLYEALEDFHIGADESLVLAGTMRLPEVGERFCAVKVLPNGTFDQTFGDGGLTIYGTLPTDRNFLMNMAYDPRGFYVLFGSLMRYMENTRSLYVFMDGSGNILADSFGETHQVITGPDSPSMVRRMTLDQAGGFVEGFGFPNRPVGISGLRRFVFSSPTAFTELPVSPSSIRTWPNPTSGTLRIDLAEPFRQKPTVTVLDPLGRVVMDGGSEPQAFTYQGDNITLNLPNTIPDGSYTVVLTSGMERRAMQVVLQR